MGSGLTGFVLNQPSIVIISESSVQAKIHMEAVEALREPLFPHNALNRAALAA
ncbi:hypothetical protein RUM44_000758, partial [Polyplax serrata]